MRENGKDLGVISKCSCFANFCACLVCIVYSVEIEIGNKEFLRKQDRGIVFVSENSKRNVIIQVHLHVNKV